VQPRRNQKGKEKTEMKNDQNVLGALGFFPPEDIQLLRKNGNKIKADEQQAMDYEDIVLLLLTAFALNKPTKYHADFSGGVFIQSKS
jgi:hypothetical protein